MKQGEALPRWEVVHRAILKRRWLDENGNITAEAFLLRPNDKQRLSTCRRDLKPWIECKEHFNRIHGGVSLRAGSIHSLGLNLKTIADPDLDRLEHASILGLPDPLEQPLLAERMASALRDIARRLPDEFWPSAVK